MKGVYVVVTKIKITRTKRDFPAYWVGGGSFTNTFEGVFVLTEHCELPSAMFVRQHGDLSCKTDQALVPLFVGEIIVKVSGPRPADVFNPDLHWEAVRIVAPIKGYEAEVEPVDFNDFLGMLPKQILEGLNRYHNRDGSYFVGQSKHMEG